MLNGILDSHGAMTMLQVLRTRAPSKFSQQIRRSLCIVPGDVFSPESVLSPESRERCMKRLSKGHSLRPPSKENTKRAAVLVPLCISNGEVSLLYTLRSSYITTHRAQVSFPGGMRDDEDPNFETTAVRETEEELGIPQHSIEIWGRCNGMAARNGVNVVPVVGSLGVIDLDTLRINPQEVGEVFTVSLRHLCNKKNFSYTQFRDGYVIPVFLGGKHRIWGLTAGITHVVLSALLPDVYKNKLYLIRPIQIDKKKS